MIISLRSCKDIDHRGFLHRMFISIYIYIYIGSNKHDAHHLFVLNFNYFNFLQLQH